MGLAPGRGRLARAAAHRRPGRGRRRAGRRGRRRRRRPGRARALDRHRRRHPAAHHRRRAGRARRPTPPRWRSSPCPGPYAVAEAADAIAAGRSVLVFSDGVPVEHEVALKRAAHDAGVLVMGPDCGTAIVSGVALGLRQRRPARAGRAWSPPPAPAPSRSPACSTWPASASRTCSASAAATCPRPSAGWPPSTRSPPSTPTRPPSGCCWCPSRRRRRSRQSVDGRRGRTLGAGALRRPLARDARPDRRRRGAAGRHGPGRARPGRRARDLPKPRFRARP